jgi:hypothetical protein
LENVENKTSNISTSNNITSISNTLNVNQVTGLTASNVSNNDISNTILGGNNIPNNFSDMTSLQSGNNIDILLAGQNNELASPIDGIVINVKFSTRNSSNNNNTFTKLIATGYINYHSFIQTASTSFPNSPITANSAFNFTTDFKIKLEIEFGLDLILKQQIKE